MGGGKWQQTIKLREPGNLFGCVVFQHGRDITSRHATFEITTGVGWGQWSNNSLNLQ